MHEGIGSLSMPTSSPPRPTRPLLRPSMRRSRYTHWSWIARSALFTTALILLSALIPCAEAAFIDFENCLDEGIIVSQPRLLQFIPLFVDAKYVKADTDLYNLNITIYGNVTGQSVEGTYPPPNSPIWSDPSNSFGKIVNASQNSNYTTLTGSADVLTYTPWPYSSSQFCTETVNRACPLGPIFTGNASNPADLNGFSIAHEFSSSYSFATFSSTAKVLSGERGARMLSCVSATITPDLGPLVANAIKYVPAAILILVGVATMLAARFSPWSSSDMFYWSSNYGRDPDLLRLITPGFGDCLQYIQFVVLAGSLSLNYPGYYQPVVSQASWSTLMFNESFVTHGPGTISLHDGIYFSSGTYGLSRMSQLVGMTDDSDAWAGMAISLCVIIAVVILLSQLGFLAVWVLQTRGHDLGGKLRGKNFPFTIGMIVRIYFNYFNLPLLSLSLFQVVISPDSPASVVATSVLVIILMLSSAGWIFRLIFFTKPRIQLFDDLSTLLAYGPLYNTYSDEAAPFAFIPVALNLLRGVAIGAVQPSGIAQIITLAICEVVMILTLHAFRPFNAPTSMNAYHTFFSIIRLVTILLSIAFTPSLGLSEGMKGWLGYLILLLHAIVLLLGFFVNSIQTILEVALRSSGAGNRDARGGLRKVFGKRQLSRRAGRGNVRSSMISDAAILSHTVDKKDIQLLDSRCRSLSASSAVLLRRQLSTGHRTSTGPDGSDWGGTSLDPCPPGATSPLSHLQSAGGAGIVGIDRRNTNKSLDQNDPYYRPPRTRKSTAGTLELVLTTETYARDLSAQPYKDSPDQGTDAGEGPSGTTSPNRNSTTPTLLQTSHYSDNASDSVGLGKSTDYAVRESDLYYGVRRGPALSSATQARRLKTGPADPMGPVSNTTGWFKGFFGGRKSKGKHKGFEVIRSRPYPLAVLHEDDQDTSPPLIEESYRDTPDTPGTGHVRAVSAGKLESGRSSITPAPPILGPIDSGGDFVVPSRMGTRSSHVPTRSVSAAAMPTLPQRSRGRTSSISSTRDRSNSQSPVFGDGAGDVSASAIASASASASQPPHGSSHSHGRNSSSGEMYLHPGSGKQAAPSTMRLPFGGADFAADGSSTEPSPNAGLGASKKLEVRESSASSFYATTEGGTPIFGGEGAGVDDAATIAGPTRHSSSAAVGIRRGFSVRDTVAGAQEERPVSTGRVGRHLASDGVRDVAAVLRQLGGNSGPSLDAYAAEFVSGGVSGGGSGEEGEHDDGASIGWGRG